MWGAFEKTIRFLATNNNINKYSSDGKELVGSWPPNNCHVFVGLNLFVRFFPPDKQIDKRGLDLEELVG